MPDYLKASVRIGTRHGRVNYKPAENAFHETDVPEEKRKAKNEIKRLASGSVLGSSERRWNQSVSTGNHSTARLVSQMTKHDPTLFKYNYRAEVLPKPDMNFVAKPGRHDFDKKHALLPRGRTAHSRIGRRKRLQELIVHPALEGKTGWDHSTSLDRTAVQKQLRASTAKCLRNSSNKNKQLCGEDYKNPAQRESERMEKLRKEKELRLSGNQHGDKVQKKAKNESTSETIKPFEKDHHHRRAPSRKYKEYYNDGVWEYSKFEQQYVWSCSMNSNPEFRGSCYKVRNPDAWNFASP